jgi:hypothetical protein
MGCGREEGEEERERRGREGREACDRQQTRVLIT